jgi:DinB superfamily
VNNTSSTIVADTGLTTEEITTASRHLSVTRGFLLESVGRLSPAQWNFKPNSETWSIAENLEHIVLIENGIHAIIERMNEPFEPVSESDRRGMDEFILTQIPKRSRKVKASENVCPTGRWSGPEALEQFIQSREQSTRLLVSRRLRGHAFPHPLFGPWDGYQWLLAAASHGARHTEQLREVKADRNFPQARN